MGRTSMLTRLPSPPRSASASKAMSFLTVTPHQPETSSASDPSFVAMFCFDDVIHPGVKGAVEALMTGSWRRGGSGADAKTVVMLTGEGRD